MMYSLKRVEGEEIVYVDFHIDLRRENSILLEILRVGSGSQISRTNERLTLQDGRDHWIELLLEGFRVYD